MLCDAAAATGTENKDTSREEDALLKVEANSLAACANIACRRGRGRAERDTESGLWRSCDALDYARTMRFEANHQLA